MEPKCVSEKLYEILLKHCLEDDDNGSDELELEEDDEETFPLECYICTELFFDETKFNQHLQECSDKSKRDTETAETKEPLKDVGKAHKCSYEDCTKSFKKSAELRKHERIHLNVRLFKCTHCPKDFIHQTSLKHHLLTHSKERNFICNICGFATATNGNLKQHLTKHDEQSQRKFSCEVCDKKFNRASNLKEHLITHSKQQNFECKTCGKKFSGSSSLSKHKKLHDGIKSFSCSICSKRFTQSSHLKKHVQSIHMSSKVCEVCDKSFQRLKAFQNHMKTHETKVEIIHESKLLILSNEIIVAGSSLDEKEVC